MSEWSQDAAGNADSMRRNYMARLGFGAPGGARVASYTTNRNKPSSFEAPAVLQESEEIDRARSISPQRKETEFTMNYLDMHAQDDFRLNFLRKLSHQKIWIPKSERESQYQACIVFDWDDTLLCTSYLNMKPDAANSPAVQKHLQLITETGIQLIETAMKFGRTFIITNAMKGWVEYSATKYIPGLLPTLKKIRIISARSEHETLYPGQYHEWKIQAFLNVQKEMKSEIITNLVSLGDSTIEMDAVHVMGNEFAQALIKTVKFRETPTPEELAKQLELVNQKFEKIILNARSLKISLERKWVPSPKTAPSPPPQ
jgi:hypothetical protein